MTGLFGFALVMAGVPRFAMSDGPGRRRDTQAGRPEPPRHRCGAHRPMWPVRVSRPGRASMPLGGLSGEAGVDRRKGSPFAHPNCDGHGGNPHRPDMGRLEQCWCRGTVNRGRGDGTTTPVGVSCPSGGPGPVAVVLLGQPVQAGSAQHAPRTYGALAALGAWPLVLVRRRTLGVRVGWVGHANLRYCCVGRGDQGRSLRAVAWWLGSRRWSASAGAVDWLTGIRSRACRAWLAAPRPVAATVISCSVRWPCP